MRFRRYSSVVALMVGISTAVGAESAGTTLTLERALSSVEGANVTVLLGRESAAQALEQANQARVGILPNINLSAQQRRTQAVTITNGNAASAAPANRFDGKLGGSYSVLNPQQISNLKSAKVGAEVAQADYRATVQSVLASVAQTYFTHLRNMRRLDVLDANITRAQALYDLAVKQVNVGVATQIDVTRAEAQLEQAKQARLQQETTLYQSELLLKRLLDLTPTSTMKLADFTVRRVDASSLVFGEDKTTFEQRAEWLRAQKAVEQSKLDVRSARFQRLPTLALGGEYGYAAGNYDDSGKKEAWFAGATVSVPIFDGLKSDADRRSALSRQRAQELRLHSLELQISSELRLARQDAASRNAQITVAEKNLRLSEDELRLARQRYTQGVADNREVVEAQNRLAIASDNIVEAVYQYNLSRVELARAKGDVRSVLAEKVE